MAKKWRLEEKTDTALLLIWKGVINDERVSKYR